MARNKLYRNFIILQEDKDNKSSIDDKKQLSGYTKVEVKGDKCKITFYAQNLISTEKYYILLVCYKKDNRKIVNLGSISVSDIGKAEKVKEYYLNNIAGLNFSYEDISGAAICKKVNDVNVYLLYGFINGENVKDDWKKCKVYDHNEDKEKIYTTSSLECNKKDKEKVKNSDIEKCEHKHKDHADSNDCKKEHKTEKYNKPNHDKQDECVKEQEKGNHDYKCKKDKVYDCECKRDDEKEEFENNNTNQEINEKENEKYISDDLKEKISKECQGLRFSKQVSSNKFDDYEKQIEKIKNKIVDPFNFDLKGNIGKFFEGVVSGFKELGSKYKEIKYCKWYKAEVNSIEDMCNTSNYNKYTIAYYPMINYYPYIKKYGYFVIGYKCDDKGNIKYIVYGVPGTKSKESQPYGGKTGFVTWMKTDGEDIGLWLMFYDYKKSTVVIPAKE